MTKRLTATDYRKEYEDLYVKLGVMEKRIQLRLLTLCKQHPDAPVYRMSTNVQPGAVIRASDIHPKFVSRQTTDVLLDYIQAIEKYLEEQHPHKQKTIEFPEVVPEAPVGERIIFIKGEAYSRQQ